MAVCCRHSMRARPFYAEAQIRRLRSEFYKRTDRFARTWTTQEIDDAHLPSLVRRLCQT
jgi:hypothetical protein